MPILTLAFHGGIIADFKNDDVHGMNKMKGSFSRPGWISEGKRVSEYLEESPFCLARPRNQSLAKFFERSVPGEREPG